MSRADHLRLLVALSLVGFLLWFFLGGSYRAFEVESLRARVTAYGALGPLMMVLLFGFTQPLGPSGHLYVGASALLWPGPVAFVTALSGALLGQVNGFLFYRYLAHDWARRRIAGRLLKLEGRLMERPFRSVLVLRLLTYTWPLVPPMLGVSRLSFRQMLLPSLLGLAPATALGVWLTDWVWSAVFR